MSDSRKFSSHDADMNDELIPLKEFDFSCDSTLEHSRHEEATSSFRKSVADIPTTSSEKPANVKRRCSADGNSKKGLKKSVSVPGKLSKGFPYKAKCQAYFTRRQSANGDSKLVPKDVKHKGSAPGSVSQVEDCELKRLVTTRNVEDEISVVPDNEPQATGSSRRELTNRERAQIPVSELEIRCDPPRIEVPNLLEQLGMPNGLPCFLRLESIEDLKRALKIGLIILCIFVIGIVLFFVKMPYLDNKLRQLFGYDENGDDIE